MGAVYTINLDSTVCSMAVEVMHRVLRGIPLLRNTMLLGMTAFLTRIPEEFPKVGIDKLKPVWAVTCSALSPATHEQANDQTGTMSHEAGVRPHSNLDGLPHLHPQGVPAARERPPQLCLVSCRHPLLASSLGLGFRF